jgi:hypothetical protein
MASFKVTSTGDLDLTAAGGLQFVYDDDAVVQQIGTRLRLTAGDWFRDLSEGTDWFGSILGRQDEIVRRAEIRARIAGTPGVRAVTRLNLSLERTSRVLTMEADVTLTSGRTLDVRYALDIPGGS